MVANPCRAWRFIDVLLTYYVQENGEDNLYTLAHQPTFFLKSPQLGLGSSKQNIGNRWSMKQILPHNYKYIR